MLDAGQADFSNLTSAFSETFDVVLSCDNSLPHLLTAQDLETALRSIHSVLGSSGLFIASARDYDKLLAAKPTATGPRLQNGPQGQSITFQIWEWSEESDTYLVRLFLMTRHASGDWQTREFCTRYRAFRRNELSSALESAGFSEIAWHDSAESGYFQPIVTARA